jgi:hypothetical protein
MQVLFVCEDVARSDIFSGRSLCLRCRDGAELRRAFLNAALGHLRDSADPHHFRRRRVVCGDRCQHRRGGQKDRVPIKPSCAGGAVGSPQAVQQTGENGTLLLPHQKGAVSGARQTNLVVRYGLVRVLDGKNRWIKCMQL